MKLITVTNDQAVEEWLNADFILGVKPRKDAGAIIRFSNGTGLNVIEEAISVVRKIEAASDL